MQLLGNIDTKSWRKNKLCFKRIDAGVILTFLKERFVNFQDTLTKRVFWASVERQK